MKTSLKWSIQFRWKVVICHSHLQSTFNLVLSYEAMGTYFCTFYCLPSLIKFSIKREQCAHRCQTHSKTWIGILILLHISITAYTLIKQRHGSLVQRVCTIQYFDIHLWCDMALQNTHTHKDRSDQSLQEACYDTASLEINQWHSKHNTKHMESSSLGFGEFRLTPQT